MESRIRPMRVAARALRSGPRRALPPERRANSCGLCRVPDNTKNTGSGPISEVKQRRARLVLGWVTACV